MHTGDVVHLFEGKRRNRGAKRDTPRSRSARVDAGQSCAAVAEVARESRALERRLLDQGGHRRFVDH